MKFAASGQLAEVAQPEEVEGPVDKEDNRSWRERRWRNPLHKDLEEGSWDHVLGGRGPDDSRHEGVAGLVRNPWDSREGVDVHDSPNSTDRGRRAVAVGSIRLCGHPEQSSLEIEDLRPGEEAEKVAGKKGHSVGLCSHWRLEGEEDLGRSRSPAPAEGSQCSSVAMNSRFQGRE